MDFRWSFHKSHIFWLALSCVEISSLLSVSRLRYCCAACCMTDYFVIFRWSLRFDSKAKVLKPNPDDLIELMKKRQQQSFYGPLSGTNRVSWYQKKHSPTYHPDHHSIFISFFHLLRSIASSLFKLRAWQSFLHNFCPHPPWSTSWFEALHLVFHTFLYPITVFFLQHMPIPLQPVLL